MVNRLASETLEIWAMTGISNWMERHLWIAQLIVFLVVVSTAVQVVVWSFDRDLPFIVTGYTATPTRAGGVLHLEAAVIRDASRECSVELGSHFYDSDGTRFSAGDAGTFVSAEGIRAIEAKTPGKLIRKLRLPDDIAPGPAALISTMHDRCNPLQDLVRPIQVQTDFRFEVLP